MGNHLWNPRDMKQNLPKRMKLGPRGLPAMFNLLRDFVVMRDVEFDEAHFAVDETTDGRRVKIRTDIVDGAKAGIGLSSPSAGNGAGGNSNTPPGTGDGDGGAGLPGVETDPDGNQTYDGKPLAWRQLNVCVDDGEGGWTPMTMDIYATAPHTPS